MYQLVYKSIFILLLTLPTLSSAKEYIGFNICGKSNADAIAKVVKQKGGSISGTLVSDESPNISVINISELKVDERSVDVSIHLLDSQIYKIELDDIIISVQLDKTYGESTKKTEENDGLHLIKKDYWNVKNDPTVNIYEYVIQTAQGHVVTTGIVYECKKLADDIEVAERTKSYNLVIATPSFSMKDKSLNKNQKGVDVDNLIAAILKAKPPVKSDFESNGDFQERMDRFASRKFAGQIGPDSRVAVIRSAASLPSSERSGLYSKYDAETETMSTTLGYDISCGFGVALSRTAIPKRQYTASNAFGHKVNVIVVDVSETCLAFSKTGTGSVSDFPQEFRFQVSKKDAPLLIPMLAIAVIGRIAPPYGKVEKSHESPDMRRPIDKTIVSRTLTLDVDAVWLINYTTGAIISKVSMLAPTRN